VSTRELGVVEENGAPRDAQDKDMGRLVALGRALADPIRVRMLSMMADGRSCCDFSDSGVPAVEGEEGICVCEFEDRRGKWSFYSLDREAAGELLGEAADRLLSAPERRSVAGGCC
jgi:ArsR family transcriptional regulator